MTTINALGNYPIPLVQGGTNSSLVASNGGIVYSTSSALALLATANNGVLITSGAGIPSISSTLPTAVQSNITTLSDITSTVRFSNISPSFDPSSAAVELDGGLSISNITDAASTTQGGSFTTAGGVAIAKKLYVGGVILGSSGSASAPSYSFTASTSSGMHYDSGAATVRWDVGGSSYVGLTAPANNSSTLFVTRSTASNSDSNGETFTIGAPFPKTGQAIYSDSTSLHNHITFYNPNGQVGKIQTSGSGTAYVTSSDYRLKTNITPMTDGLARIMNTKPVYYTWVNTGQAGQGFLAHELEQHFPDAVTGVKDGLDKEGRMIPQGTDTSFMIAALCSAIQELSAKIDQLTP